MNQMSENLKNIGVDVDGVIARLGGNEYLYLSICSKFLQDQSYLLATNALSDGNLKEAELQVHTLKGVAANLGFVKLHSLCKQLLDDIRLNQPGASSVDHTLLAEEYQKITKILEMQ